MSDAVEDTVLTKVENGVLWITLNRPDSGNAVTPDQRDLLIDVFADASADLAVRAVVLTAAGDKMFCPGADLRAPRPAPREQPDGAPDIPTGTTARTIRTGAQALISAVLDCERPVIAAVNGTAAGLGAHLAFASDLVIAAEESKFIEVFVRRGLIPDAGGAWLLPRLVGIQKAKELMFFGDDIPAARAAELGLVNEVVPRSDLEATAREWAERLAEGPTRALALTKWMVNRSLDVDRRTAFDEEAWGVEVNMTTEDSQEGVAAFVERRETEFKGW